MQPAYWRQGFTTEVMLAILTLAKNEMKAKCIYAHSSVDSVGSLHLAEKLGFLKTGKRYYEEFRWQKFLHDIDRLTL